LAASRLARSVDRLQGGIERAIESRNNLADRLAAQLDALSPLRVLGRGYAVPLDQRGRVLKRRADFRKDESFRLRVVDGDVRARVE
jgi:exodeoxyribonuclease VII large subunit